MGVYFITIIIMALLCWALSIVSVKETAEQSVSKERLLRAHKDKKIIVFLIFLLMAFVAAFRYWVGTDFYVYYRTYIYSTKFAKKDFTEPGFTILAILADWLFQGKNGGLTILSAAITVALFIFTIAKRSENLTVSLFLFIFVGCFTGMFNGVRQYLATGILFAGFHFVQEKKLLKWTLIVLLATSIHVTAILMFFVYFACNLKCDLKTVLLYIVLAILLLFLYEPLFNLVGALKQEEINTEVGYVTRQVNILRILVQCVPVVLLVFVPSSKINKDTDCKTLFNISLLNAAIAVASMNSAYFARFFIYTMCFQILMYPKMLNKMDKTTKKILTVLLISLYAIFWLYEVANSSSLNNFQWIFKYL